MIENTVDLLNYLIETRYYRRYLEIGVRHGNTLFNVNCKYIVGVDPDPESMATIKMTSDQYFGFTKDRFDLIFVDGLHEAAQVEKDLLNSLGVLNPGGMIVVHDCNPAEESMQTVPRSSVHWTGDVWKAWVKFRKEWDYKSYVIDLDFGYGIIEYDGPRARKTIHTTQYEWPDLVKQRADLLGLVSLSGCSSAW